MNRFLLLAFLLVLPCCEKDVKKPVMDIVCPDGVGRCAHGSECTPDSKFCTSHVFWCQDRVHWCGDGAVCSPDNAQCVHELTWCPDGIHWCSGGQRCSFDSRHCGDHSADDGVDISTFILFTQ
jgi:hypothetical protein